MCNISEQCIPYLTSLSKCKSMSVSNEKYKKYNTYHVDEGQCVIQFYKAVVTGYNKRAFTWLKSNKCFAKERLSNNRKLESNLAICHLLGGIFAWRTNINMHYFYLFKTFTQCIALRGYLTKYISVLYCPKSFRYRKIKK